MPKGRRTRLFNFLAAVCLGLSVVSLGWIVSIAINPYGRLNPFPPGRPSRQPTPIAAMTVTATATVMATVQHESTPAATPTDTTTMTVPPSPTLAVPMEPTQEANSTPLPTIEVSPSPTPTLTPRPSPTRSPFTYTAIITLQVHPVQVCDWMGIAGTVTDLQGRPALGAFVRVWGLGNLDQTVVVGANPIYGPSGWEVRLARAQLVGSWNVQLVASPEAKTTLSDVYTISMPGDCKRNLALVSLQQNH